MTRLMRLLAILAIASLGFAPPAHSAEVDTIVVKDGNGVSRETPTILSLEQLVSAIFGATSDAACSTDNGTCTEIALLKRVAQRLTTLIASLGGTASTAAAVPATAVYVAGGSDGGLSAGTAALTGLITCGNSVKIDTASSGNTELVALTSGETVYVCGYELIAGGTVSVQFITGTGTACATGEFDETGAMPLVANSGLVSRSPFWTGLSSGASEAFCIELSAAVQVSGILYYTKF